MFKKLYYTITGDPNEKVLKKYRPIVEQINSLEKEFERKSAEELRAMTQRFKERIAEATADLRAALAEAEQEYLAVLGTDNQKFARVEVERLKKELRKEEERILWEILPEAFAAVREASKRTTGLRHYDVQLLGGMVLHSGRIAEMKTGEGKTLVATLPLYLNALTGHGVHLVTPNDYLSKVGLQLMGPIYHMLGLSAAVIQNSAGHPDQASFLFDPEFPNADDRFQYLKPITRREAYLADITYGTNNEFGFDYLRDNMVRDISQVVQRELHYAIVDEVDNILIDEARTPLIISGEARESSDYYVQFANLAKRLTPGKHYVVNEKEMTATLTEEGIAYVERTLGIDNLYDPEHFEMLPYLDNALRAVALYHRDRDYIVRGNEVIIVDEFTGRLMEGRRYAEGLHQAIEAKEGVKVQKESMTLATITFQNYFRMYNKLAGMTGTAKTEEEEFQRIYDLEVVQIPTYKPVIRQDLDDLVYRTQEAKFKAVLEDIKEKHRQGRPVLVGTVAIETSEYVSNLLKRNGIPHEVLNAKNHEREATIIAQAGRPGAVTIATNMAGRGVDILLGGNAEGLAREQLRKEQFDLSTIRQSEWNRAVDMLKRGQDPTTIYSDRWAQVLTEQWRAVERDRELVRQLGGLHVIGTERHEARRIDNQLRGRAGRLGDPGSSRFYLSLEDDLMRKFGGERIAGIMARLGVEDDVPIEAGLVNKAIENAQTKVEGYNFDIRKHVLRYDEVVNEQRNRIYEQRRRILTEPSLRPTIEDMITNEVRELVAQHTAADLEDEWELEELAQALRALVHHLPSDFSPKRWENKKRSEIEADAIALALQAYEAKEKEIGEELMRGAEKQLMLMAVDSRWVRHLTDLDRLREGIGLRALAQQDPVVAYKREAFEMYSEMINAIRSDTVRAVFSLSLQPQTQQVPVFAPIARNIRTNRDGGDGKPQTVRKSGHQLGRNDPCWCGSGKKYKNCHMKSDLAQGTPQRVAAK
ncbi:MULTISPECIES: preprotein translocase subunit SecA [Caldilinea]|jgi:preprotein translocase subunit SecA|uniref:Protein translocase subunit SecA n=1 Tax=Caldilinea aerophila (strain DSM 14535 / JCM 11387 / NBRC 104270 / STL-6-O1) TaxID=926550 RepID=I0I9E7_CALAS|nr:MULTISPECIES: preprotein translocase subunit SecA [Caldilinea]MBO9394563.1 preprotein translocase subunit SecA [Caldilinea sp.]BAM01885.1 protein translocase subunit SecA [Caldilinea aerophila DSM 14535 = NBRC 104270]GIV73224.1 MAG: protein translocase subunit SecA [Caldilinea sp.]